MSGQGCAISGMLLTAALWAGAAQAGFHDFDGFVQARNLQYGPDHTDTDRVYALAVAKNEADPKLRSLRADSVAINQTFNTAVVALAEKSTDDPAKGNIHYVAFVASQIQPRTCIFTENVSVLPDGTIRSDMADGNCREWIDDDERNAYYSLSSRFGEDAAKAASSFRFYLNEAGMAAGGERSLAGAYRVDLASSLVTVSSAVPLNEVSGVEIGQSYGKEGGGTFLLRVFRENADGAMEKAAEAAAPVPANPGRYVAFSGMTPGIHLISR